MLIDDTSLVPVDVEAELDEIARRYRNAGGLGLQVLNLMGKHAENMMERLPASVRDRLGDATENALRLSMKAAHGSRGVIADQPGWLNTTVTTAMGAAGGMGGLPSALAELPVTTTVLLRAIQGVAAEHGFDPASENVQFDCIQIFASAGPLSHDDGADMAFLSTRMALRGASMQMLISRIAPKLAHVMGQKLAAQAVPVLGAVAGAATNYAYTSYYQEMAHVHFRMRRLAIEADQPHDQLLDELRLRVTNTPQKMR